MTIRLTPGDHSHDSIYIVLKEEVTLRVLEVMESIEVCPIGLIKNAMYCEIPKWKRFTNVRWNGQTSVITTDQANFFTGVYSFNKVMKAIQLLSGVESTISLLAHIPKDALKEHFLTGKTYVDFDNRILLEYKANEEYEYKHIFHIAGNVYTFTNKEIEEYVNQQ